MTFNISNKLKKSRRPKVINKTFEDFRQELKVYAKSNFPNQIKDFSQNSLGGMFLDFAAIIGESMSFYLEQQFNELNYETATNIHNIQRHLRQSGITSNFATPSTTKVSFFIEVPSEGNTLVPMSISLPVIKKFTELSSTSDINFILLEDIDFRDTPEVEVGDIDENNEVVSLILKKEGICSSGKIESETVFFPADEENLFLSYEILNNNVTKIIDVVDENLNTYYEVEYLSQDTVYKKTSSENNNYYNLHYASHRFTRENNLINNTTLIRFGNGKDETIKDDILVNPEDMSMPIVGRSYDSKFSLDPKRLLNTNTLGISPQGKSLNIKYQFGGGVNHNVSENSINTIESLNIEYPEIVNLTEENEAIINLVTESLSLTNEEKSTGGTNKLSLEELIQHIPTYKKMQNRIISDEDMLSRIYTMPSEFGRVSKANILENPYSNLSKNLYIICKDSENKYTYASDGLKINLRNYLNDFRLIGDAYNIIDSPIYNFGIDLVIKINSGFEAESVLNEVFFEIIENMRFDRLEISQGINVNDIVYIALGVEGVSSVKTEKKDIITLKSSKNDFFSESLEEDIVYSNNDFSVYNNYEDGFVYPPTGGIFELKYEDFDIRIRNG
jgi:hypothetical protein